MTERRFRHLPVVDGDRLIGIVTIGDIGKAIIADQKIAIHDLDSYITGTPCLPFQKDRRINILRERLPELFKRVDALACVAV